MKRKRKIDSTKVIASSGNIFADLGLKDAAERKTKLRLAFELNRILAEGKFTQVSAAKKLGINQPKISALRNYKLDGFSVERLMTFLVALDHDIDIVIRMRPLRGKTGRINVRAA